MSKKSSRSAIFWEIWYFKIWNHSGCKFAVYTCRKCVWTLYFHDMYMWFQTTTRHREIMGLPEVLGPSQTLGPMLYWIPMRYWAPPWDFGPLWDIGALWNIERPWDIGPLWNVGPPWDIGSLWDIGPNEIQFFTVFWRLRYKKIIPSVFYATLFVFLSWYVISITHICM